MIQSSQQVWSAASRLICLNPVWLVGCEGSRREPEPELSEGERSEAEVGPQPTKPNWIQTNLATSLETKKPVG